MKRSKEQTRDRILDAAYGLFWRQGFLRVSVDEIAARAGITKRALYQHFRSKDDLMAAALANASHLAIARLKEFRRPVRRDELTMALMLIHGDRGYATAAAKAARLLVRQGARGQASRA